MFPSDRNSRQSSSFGRDRYFGQSSCDRKPFHSPSEARRNRHGRRRDDDRRDYDGRRRKRFWNGDRNSEEEKTKNYAKACEANDYETRREEEEKRRRELEEEARDEIAGSMRFGAAGDSSSDDEMPDMSSPVYNRESGSSDSDAPVTKKKKIKVIPSNEDLYEPLTKFHMSGRPPFVVCKKLNISEKKFEFAGFIPQSRPKKPPTVVSLDVKQLKSERVENYYKPRSFGEIDENGTFRLDTVAYDPTNARQISKFEPVNEPQIEWDLKEFTDFQAMAFLQRSVFSQSLPSKRRKFLEILKNCSGRTRQMKATLWIKIIELEDEIWKEDGRISGSVDIAARKLAMINTGLEECRGNMDLELYKIDVVAEKYGIDGEEVKNAWDTVINKYPNNLEMWRKYISFHRSKKLIFDCFKYEKYVTRCLEKLGSIVSGNFKSHQKQKGTENLIVDVVISSATMWIESGRTHKVIALLQAYIDFYLFPPGDYLRNFRNLLNEFRNYWNSSIVKPGHPEAKGWKNSKTVKTEQEELREIAIRYKEAKNKAAILVKNGLEKGKHDIMIWRDVEKNFTEYFWEPFLNEFDDNCKSMLMVYSYVSFEDIKPYLIEYDPSTGLEYPLRVVFSLLSRLGAVIPGFDDFSQEELCKEWSDSFLTMYPLEYKNLNIFVENVLKLMSFAKNDLSLRCLIGIIMTKRRELEKKAIKSGGDFNLTEASKELLEKTAKYLDFFNPIKSPNPIFCQYKNLYLSFVIEQMTELKLFFENILDDETPMVSNKMNQYYAQLQVFEDMSPLALLSNLRTAVMSSRNFEHYMGGSNENTKLAFLHRIVVRDLAVSNCPEVSEEDLRKSLKIWKKKEEEIQAMRTSEDMAWVGTIQDYFQELYATFLYEYEKNPKKKFNYVQKVLQGWNEDKENQKKAEIYYTFWKNHLKMYKLSIMDFMKNMKNAIEIFPKSPKLLKYYVDWIPKNLISGFFALEAFNTKNEIVKIIRAICQIAIEKEKLKEFDEIFQNRIKLHEIIKKTAEMCSSTISSETYFWRVLVVDAIANDSEELEEILLIATQQCCYSKLLFLEIASDNRTIKTALSLPTLAKEKNQLIHYTVAQMKADFIESAKKMRSH